MELLLKIFETKIFPVHKVNFMQYIPLFVISLTKDSQDAETTEKCKIFSEKLISFLIFKAFPQNGWRSEHLNVRQHAWNYLASLLSRESEIVRPSTVIKCLQYIMKHYNSSMANLEEPKTKLQRSPSIHSQYS